jgi:Spy/CpxP family protein refolding chaperone
MISRKRMIQVGVAGLLGAGLLMAQVRGNFSGRPEAMREFIAVFLGLTDAQKEQGKAIFENSRTAAQPIVEQLKAGHDEMAAAVKRGATDTELQAIADEQGALIGQLIGKHAQSMSKFYALLTPEQKGKADKLHSMMKERLQDRFGGRRPF